MGVVRRALRVVAGVAGSVPLHGPPAGVRPTSDRVRELLFSSLGDVVADRPFIDMFAGSGAVGIEALSRGASRCLFIERRAACVKVIRANLAKTRLSDRAELWQADAARVWRQAVEWLEGQSAVVFLDPPYSHSAATKLIKALLASALLPSGSIVIYEHACRSGSPELPQPSWHRRVGQTCLSRWEM